LVRLRQRGGAFTLPYSLPSREGNFTPSSLSALGYYSSLWQREVRRDFIIDVFILMSVLITRTRTPVSH
jgi:hypothetical protein